MKSELHEVMLGKIADLRKCVSRHSTDAMLGHCGWAMNMNLLEAYEVFGLKSPHAQCLYALGLMLDTTEPQNPSPIDPASWNVICGILGEIHQMYATHFNSCIEERDHPLTPMQHMAVSNYFLHRQGMPRIAGVSHLTQRIKKYLVPFDTETKALVGLSASEALRIADWIMKLGQSDLDQYNDAVEHNLIGVRLETVWRHRFGWLTDRQWHAALTSEKVTTRPISPSRSNNLLTISPEDMKNEFGVTAAERFCGLFVSIRGNATNVNYPTDLNPAQQKPVFQIDEKRMFHPPGRFIYNAILDTFTQVLLESNTKDKFLRHRDEMLEHQGEDCLKQFFGSSAMILTSVFEDDGHEHDIVVLWRDRILVMEAKATPPTEAFRDPEKAWLRLSRAFRSNHGIQKAFEQGKRLVNQCLAGRSLRLLNERREILVEVPAAAISAGYGVCLTLEDHGPVATDLSILLKRDEGDAYPWAVSIIELELILDGFAFVGIGPEGFFDFLEQRRRLHGHVFPYDESELAGIFICYGSLKELLALESRAYVILYPKDGDVFDQIQCEKLGGPKAMVKADGIYKLHKA